MLVSKAWFRCAVCVGAAATSIGLVFACSSKSSGGGGSNENLGPPGTTDYVAPDGEVSALEVPGTCSGPTGGAVLGVQDDHCWLPDGGQFIQPTEAGGCVAGPDAAPPESDAASDASSDVNIGNCGDNDYGATMYNNWGSDDDCKYDVEWQSTPICQGQPAYFTVVVTKRQDNTPLEGVETGGTFVPANPRPDVVLSCDHPIPNAPAPRNPSVHVAPGTYVVGPIVFDQSGTWVFRFHFNEECLDFANDSPHGHAAFYINVP
jgi:hypothetical protein